MAVKQRGVEHHSVQFSDGKTLKVKNYYTYNTRNGVCETSVAYLEWGEGMNWETKVDYKGRYSWYNRPWQSFDYEKAMKGMIAKLPKEYQERATAVLIDKTAKEVEERCEAVTAAFTKAHEALSENGKQFFAEHTPMMNSIEDAKAMTAMMGLYTLMES